MSSPYAIRGLTSDDLASFRSLRLESLLNFPDIFGVDFSEENEAATAYFLHLLETSQWFGVFQNQSLDGIAALRFYIPSQFRHRAGIWGMYLKAALRGKGVGKGLLLHVCEAAKKQHIEQIELRVMDHNEKARRFYKKHGFKEIGHTPQIVKLKDGTYRDDTIYLRFLNDEN